MLSLIPCIFNAIVVSDPGKMETSVKMCSSRAEWKSSSSKHFGNLKSERFVQRVRWEKKKLSAPVEYFLLRPCSGPVHGLYKSNSDSLSELQLPCPCPESSLIG
ncbi:MAG TPA: hypothetical protein DD473_26705 [Planctomycetaceae bacterium]|nr:hypothetical protein [Planctomycetaceae bacterium]